MRPLTSKLGEGYSGNVQNSLSHKHWWDSEWLFLPHFALCSLFAPPFHNISILFPVFLLGLSRGTPTPTLKPCHRQEWKVFGRYQKATRVSQDSGNSLVVGMNAEHGRVLFLGTFPDLQPAWVSQQRREAGREQEMHYLLNTSSLNRSASCQLQQSPTLPFF